MSEFLSRVHTYQQTSNDNEIEQIGFGVCLCVAGTQHISLQSQWILKWKLWAQQICNNKFVVSGTKSICLLVFVVVCIILVQIVWRVEWAMGEKERETEAEAGIEGDRKKSQ